jgi:hypothetical protein
MCRAQLKYGCGHRIAIRRRCARAGPRSACPGLESTNDVDAVCRACASRRRQDVIRADERANTGRVLGMFRAQDLLVAQRKAAARQLRTALGNDDPPSGTGGRLHSVLEGAVEARETLARGVGKVRRAVEFEYGKMMRYVAAVFQAVRLEEQMVDSTDFDKDSPNAFDVRQIEDGAGGSEDALGRPTMFTQTPSCRYRQQGGGTAVLAGHICKSGYLGFSAMRALNSQSPSGKSSRPPGRNATILEKPLPDIPDQRGAYIPLDIGSCALSKDGDDKHRTWYDHIIPGRYANLPVTTSEKDMLPAGMPLRSPALGSFFTPWMSDLCKGMEPATSPPNPAIEGRSVTDSGTSRLCNVGGSHRPAPVFHRTLTERNGNCGSWSPNWPLLAEDGLETDAILRLHAITAVDGSNPVPREQAGATTATADRNRPTDLIYPITSMDPAGRTLPVSAVTFPTPPDSDALYVRANLSRQAHVSQARHGAMAATFLHTPSSSWHLCSSCHTDSRDSLPSQGKPRQAMTLASPGSDEKREGGKPGLCCGLVRRRAVNFSRPLRPRTGEACMVERCDLQQAEHMAGNSVAMEQDFQELQEVEVYELEENAVYELDDNAVYELASEEVYGERTSEA